MRLKSEEGAAAASMQVTSIHQPPKLKLANLHCLVYWPALYGLSAALLSLRAAAMLKQSLFCDDLQTPVSLQATRFQKEQFARSNRSYDRQPLGLPGEYLGKADQVSHMIGYARLNLYSLVFAENVV